MKIKKDYIKKNYNKNIFAIKESRWIRFIKIHEFKFKLSKVNVIIKLSVNNVFLTAITAKGRVICKSSNGLKKQENTKKKNVPLSLYKSAVYIAETLEARGFLRYTIYFIGKVSPVVRTVLRGLDRIRSVKCNKIIQVQSVAHNGVRLPLPKKNK